MSAPTPSPSPSPSPPYPPFDWEFSSSSSSSSSSSLSLSSVTSLTLSSSASSSSSSSSSSSVPLHPKLKKLTSHLNSLSPSQCLAFYKSECSPIWQFILTFLHSKELSDADAIELLALFQRLCEENSVKISGKWQLRSMMTILGELFSSAHKLSIRMASMGILLGLFGILKNSMETNGLQLIIQSLQLHKWDGNIMGDEFPVEFFTLSVVGNPSVFPRSFVESAGTKSTPQTDSLRILQGILSFSANHSKLSVENCDFWTDFIHSALLGIFYSDAPKALRPPPPSLPKNLKFKKCPLAVHSIFIDWTAEIFHEKSTIPAEWKFSSERFPLFLYLWMKTFSIAPPGDLDFSTVSTVTGLLKGIFRKGPSQWNALICVSLIEYSFPLLTHCATTQKSPREAKLFVSLLRLLSEFSFSSDVSLPPESVERLSVAAVSLATICASSSADISVVREICEFFTLAATAAPWDFPFSVAESSRSALLNFAEIPEVQKILHKKIDFLTRWTAATAMGILPKEFQLAKIPVKTLCGRWRKFISLFILGNPPPSPRVSEVFSSIIQHSLCFFFALNSAPIATKKQKMKAAMIAAAKGKEGKEGNSKEAEEAKVTGVSWDFSLDFSDFDRRALPTARTLCGWMADISMKFAADNLDRAMEENPKDPMEGTLMETSVTVSLSADSPGDSNDFPGKIPSFGWVECPMRSAVCRALSVGISLMTMRDSETMDIQSEFIVSLHSLCSRVFSGDLSSKRDFIFSAVSSAATLFTADIPLVGIFENLFFSISQWTLERQRNSVPQNVRMAALQILRALIHSENQREKCRNLLGGLLNSLDPSDALLTQTLWALFVEFSKDTANLSISSPSSPSPLTSPFPSVFSSSLIECFSKNWENPVALSIVEIADSFRHLGNHIFQIEISSDASPSSSPSPVFLMDFLIKNFVVSATKIFEKFDREIRSAISSTVKGEVKGDEKSSENGGVGILPHLSRLLSAILRFLCVSFVSSPPLLRNSSPSIRSALFKLIAAIRMFKKNISTALSAQAILSPPTGNPSMQKGKSKSSLMGKATQSSGGKEGDEAQGTQQSEDPFRLLFPSLLSSVSSVISSAVRQVEDAASVALRMFFCRGGEFNAENFQCEITEFESDDFIENPSAQSFILPPYSFLSVFESDGRPVVVLRDGMGKFCWAVERTAVEGEEEKIEWRDIQQLTAQAKLQHLDVIQSKRKALKEREKKSQSASKGPTEDDGEAKFSNFGMNPLFNNSLTEFGESPSVLSAVPVSDSLSPSAFRHQWSSSSSLFDFSPSASAWRSAREIRMANDGEKTSEENPRQSMDFVLSPSTKGLSRQRHLAADFEGPSALPVPSVSPLPTDSSPSMSPSVGPMEMSMAAKIFDPRGIIPIDSFIDSYAFQKGGETERPPPPPKGLPSPSPPRVFSLSSVSSKVSPSDGRSLVQRIYGGAATDSLVIPPLQFAPPSARLHRSLRLLDSLPSRECHKMGVVFVGPSQDNQLEILQNDFTERHFKRHKGISDTESKHSEYFEFLESLGESIDLHLHGGFSGGLDVNSTGVLSTYWADREAEILFHVVTQMETKNSLKDPQQINKKKQVGNDHLNIIWSEFPRDYRPSTISSEFNDCQIVISPTEQKGIFRVQTHCKESKEKKIISFGPLPPHSVSFLPLPLIGPLVRLTALWAMRAIRGENKNFQTATPARDKFIADCREKEINERDNQKEKKNTIEHSWEIRLCQTTTTSTQ